MGVDIVAAAQTPFGDHVDRGVKELFGAAVDGLAERLGDRWDPGLVEAAWIGSLSCGQGMQLGNFAPALLDHAGLPPVPALHTENACASGGFALHQAIRAVVSGEYRCVLAAGVEKMRDVSSEQGRYWLGISGDTEYERLAGMTFAGLFGVIADRLIQADVCTREDLARIAVKNHRHGLDNPMAHLRRAITVDDVLAAPPVASPLGVLDCCPTSDGAAVVLVADAEVSARLCDGPVPIAGWGEGGDTIAVHGRPDITRLAGTQRAARAAYRAAGITPDDLDLVELHDCFTVSEVINVVELGLCDRRDVAGAIRADEFALGGRLPVNASGGLKSKGHPIGATGISQVVELFHQLRGESDASARQVADARYGLAHNMGGSGASVAVTILRAP